MYNKDILVRVQLLQKINQANVKLVEGILKNINLTFNELINLENEINKGKIISNLN